MGAVRLKPPSIDEKAFDKALQMLEGVGDHRRAWSGLVRPGNIYRALLIAAVEAAFIGQQASAIDSDIRRRIERQEGKGENNQLKTGIVDIFWRVHCLLLFGGLSLAYFSYVLLTSPEEILETVKEVGSGLRRALIECPVERGFGTVKK